MLYLVELDFIGRGREAAWNAWYGQHVGVLLTVPGFLSAQRFLCLTPHPSPYLAIYTVESAAVLESAAYRGSGGRDSVGEWKPLMVNWHRNLYGGIERAPAVAPDERLLVTEQDPPHPAAAGLPLRWMDNCGLDRNMGRRALAVVRASDADPETLKAMGIRAYAPLTPQLPGTSRS